MARLVENLDYANFKDEVAKRQGPARSHLYHDVWSVLYRLQKQPAAKPSAPPVLRVHPKLDHEGKEVPIKRPSKTSPLSAWPQADQLASVLPEGRLPAALGTVPFEHWTAAPSSPEGWQTLAQASLIDEPVFKAPKGLDPAAGVVVQEPDGRIWLVCPTNQFGGYEITFPKGRSEGKSLQATALCEAYEESGLQVRLLRHLVDVRRTQTYTRYYLAERVGGSPADMGWESQCVMLAPPAQWPSLGLQAPDQLVIKALS
jgi:ADP-ribose pyrophosphatase YjhB (NUDIX family)